MKSSDTFSSPRIKEEGDVKMDTLTSPSPAAVTSPSPHQKNVLDYKSVQQHGLNLYERLSHISFDQLREVCEFFFSFLF